MTKTNLALITVYLLLMALVLPKWLPLVLFDLGVLVGLGLLEADGRWLHRYYLEEQIKASHFSELITRSPMFVLSLIPLSIFVVTSAGSFFVEGLVLGIILTLVSEMWQLKRTPKLFKQRFLTGLKLKNTDAEIKSWSWLALGFFLFINLLLVI